MKADTLELSFSGGILQRGFWLYIWEIKPPNGTAQYYVGRTGDSSSPNAQSPFNRMGQHLGFAQNSNMLRRHLEGRQIEPEQCQFRLVAHGPIELESVTGSRAEHAERRDRVAAMEKALTGAMKAAGYQVMNEVMARKPLDALRFTGMLAAFSAAFLALAESSFDGEGQPK